MDSHCLPFVTQVLGEIKSNFEKLMPAFTVDQTDTNLNRLVHGQTDLVIGIKDSKFKDDSIDFKTLHYDGFVIAFPKNHPVVKKAKKIKLTEIPQEMLWEYPQVVQIPPLRSFWLRRKNISNDSWSLTNYALLNLSLPCLHRGQCQSSGKSSKRVPAGIPCFSSPTAGS